MLITSKDVQLSNSLSGNVTNCQRQKGDLLFYFYSLAQSVYSQWRLRTRIEHAYRFDQEQSLDVEDMRVQTVERVMRLFVLVLVAAQFVFQPIERWPHVVVQWLHEVGGKLGLAIDRDSPYPLLRGSSAVWQTLATLTHLALPLSLIMPLFLRRLLLSCG